MTSQNQAVKTEVPIFCAGDLIYWSYTPRGGYGWTYRVLGVVKKVARKRVQIEVTRDKTGEKELRWVTPEKLQKREQ